MHLPPEHSITTLDVIHQMDALQLLLALADNSIDLAVYDFPYMGVKEDAWDNQWKTVADYLAWLRPILAETKRVLKPNGSFYGFASPQMSARVEITVQDYFNVLNNIVWVKPYSRHSGADRDTLRGYFPQTERIVFAEQRGSDEYASGESGFIKAENELRAQIFGRTIQHAMHVTKTSSNRLAAIVGAHGEVNHGGAVANWIAGYNIPTREYYYGMKDYFKRFDSGLLCAEYDDLRQQYDDLRQQYDDLRRPFETTIDYTDVWNFAPVQSYPGKHPCEKPLEMMEHIIKVSTRPGAVVLDCFAGSGATLDAARRLDRRYIGCDTSAEYVRQARRRLAQPYTLPMFERLPDVTPELKQRSLFAMA